jgi:3-oxoacyl-[acyl-carrier-protein] synthase-3
MDAFITGVGAFLPNEPVANDRIESVLGIVNGKPSRIKQIILQRNGITARHYARDPQTGRQTHTNAQVTAEAIRSLARAAGFGLDEIDVLACGTSSPDQIVPSHASMVHGEVGCPSCDVASMSGVCCSGMSALKYAFLSVRAGGSRLAVAAGSELASSWLQAGAFGVERNGTTSENDPYIAFEQDFLRWMLSDGAGAVAIEPRPRLGRPCLRVEWVDVASLANLLEPCMYCGAVKEEGKFRTWRELSHFDEVWRKGYLNLAQDVKLLKEKIITFAFRETFSRVRDKYALAPEQIDWWLPHLSSEFFRGPTYEMLAEMKFEIPRDRWFTNLGRKGNTGAASIFIMLEELWSSGRLQPGQKVLLGVPESARFTFAYALCTVM